MNGIHDMGGMHGMGPLPYERNEPVFHARWESRAFALFLLAEVPDKGRYRLERIPPAEYLKMSYYERWLTVTEQAVIRERIATPEELKTGKMQQPPPKPVPKSELMTAAQLPIEWAKGFPSRKTLPVKPAFHAGQRVRARNLNPEGHTRLPRYVRGKAGSIERDHGVFIWMPDTDAQGKKLHDPKEGAHVYAVRFTARELWGEQAPPRDTVVVDLWESYLEPA